MSIITSKTERVRFLKFAFVGLTGTVVDFGVMNVLRLFLEVPLIWAQGISFVCAVINNFLWNRYWTYPESRSRSAHKQLIQFFIINVVGILIRTPLVPWLNSLILGFLMNRTWDLPLSDIVISQNSSLAISIGIVTLWNFFANRYWTFNNIPDGDVHVSDKSSEDHQINHQDI